MSSSLSETQLYIFAKNPPTTQSREEGREESIVDDDVIGPDAPEQPRPPRRPGDGSVAALVAAILAGVGSLYASTHSVLVTSMTIVLVAVVLLTRQ